MNTPNTIPTIDELIELPEAFEPQISPDGRWVAYVLRQPDWKQNEYLSQIWLAAADQSSAPRQLTFGKSSAVSPRWSPDGRWLAFLARRPADSAQQVYRISPFGGEAERLTEIERGVAKFSWAPDGQQIALIAPGPEAEPQKQRREKYGDFNVVDQDYVRLQVWVIPAFSPPAFQPPAILPPASAGNGAEKSGGADSQLPKPKAITSLKDGHVNSLAWRPGTETSVEMALEIWPSPDMADSDVGRLALVNLRSLELTWLTGPGCIAPNWSPDGSALAFLRAGSPSYAANETLCILQVGAEIAQESAQADARVMLPGFDENPGIEHWRPAGLFFSAIQRTEVHLFELQPESGACRQVTPADLPGWVTSEASLSADGAWAALTAFRQSAYKEVYLLETASGKIQPLTQLTQRTRAWHLGQSEVISWHSQDGSLVEGILTKPAEFDPEYKHPLLVVLHGGPASFSHAGLLGSYERRYYPFHNWVAKGALVLQVNYRGSAGYGEAFRRLNERNLGLGDYWDVISGVDHLIEQGWVDPERLGVMGWSQGGYISAFIATYSSRFKAVSVGAGISNWVTYYVNTDVHPFTRQYLQATPWQDPEIYARTSPMNYIQQAKTPTLIQHGEYDSRVPIPNAFELYQGLKDQGVETKLVVYRGMGHGITRPRLTRQVMEENLNWFNRWLWDEKPAESGPTVCYAALGSVEKATHEGDLPASQRYTAPRLQEASQWARRDQADFRIFSPKFGLLAPDAPIPWYDHTLIPEHIPALARQAAEKIKAAGWKKLVLFTGDPVKDPTLLYYLGCFQVAAGIVGGVTVEHRTISDPGW